MFFFYGLENNEGHITNSKDLESLYHPKEQVVNTLDYYNTIPCQYHLPSSFYAFYNIYMCNEMKKKYEVDHGFEYDLVIRSRSDYFWFRYLTSYELELAKSNILIPMDWAFKCVHKDARADVFAIGSSEWMNKYSSMYNRIDEYISKIGMFHPETICGTHLLINNIPNIENERCVVFEYPGKRTEKYIPGYRHIKQFEEPDIADEDMFLKSVSNKRKHF